MQSTPKSKKSRHNKVSIDLPAQKTWKELERFGVESSQGENVKMNGKKAKKISQILDKAFELLLEKMILQN